MSTPTAARAAPWRASFAAGFSVLLLLHTAHISAAQGRMADVLAGALVNLVLVEEGEGRAAFAAAGGIEVACALLHARGRQDSSVAGWRLRLLLADLANDSRYDVQVGLRGS